MGVASMKVFLRQTRGGGDCVKPVNIINVFISTLKFQSVNFLQHSHNHTQAFFQMKAELGEPITVPLISLKLMTFSLIFHFHYITDGIKFNITVSSIFMF